MRPRQFGNAPPLVTLALQQAGSRKRPHLIFEDAHSAYRATVAGPVYDLDVVLAWANVGQSECAVRSDHVLAELVWAPTVFVTS